MLAPSLGGTLVYFYIYSHMGKFMNEFFPPKYFVKYSKFENTILFMAGTEFLVCKRVEKFDY